MKIALSLVSMMVSGSALAGWAGSVGRAPAYPVVCVSNDTPYNVSVLINGQSTHFWSGRMKRVQVYQNAPVLVQMNTRQLAGPYANPIWTQTYVDPTYYSCGPRNTVSVYSFGPDLGLR